MKYLMLMVFLLTGCTISDDLDKTQREVNKLLVKVNRQSACVEAVTETRKQLWAESGSDLSENVRQKLIIFCLSQDAK